MYTVIVLGGEAPSPKLLTETVKHADFIIAADSGLMAFEKTGIDPDLLVGDMDSVASDVLKRYEERLPEHRLCAIKDDTDGVDALDIAIAKGAKQITLLGALGGRLDHAMANLMLLVRAHRRGARAEIVGENVRITRVDGRAELKGAKGDTVSLVPMGEARGITLKGFFYPLTNHTLTSDYPLGISNVVVQENAIVTVEEGDLMMFHYNNGAIVIKESAPEMVL